MAPPVFVADASPVAAQVKLRFRLCNSRSNQPTRCFLIATPQPLVGRRAWTPGWLPAHFYHDDALRPLKVVQTHLSGLSINFSPLVCVWQLSSSHGSAVDSLPSLPAVLPGIGKPEQMRGSPETFPAHADRTESVPAFKSQSRYVGSSVQRCKSCLDSCCKSWNTFRHFKTRTWSFKKSPSPWITLSPLTCDFKAFWSILCCS